MAKQEFAAGDWVVYRKSKFSTHPGPRAQDVAPAPRGEQYAYTVEKFWIVVDVNASGQLTLQTRRGKQHRVAPDDPNLRRVRWWERFLYRKRFQGFDEGGEKRTRRREDQE